MHTLKSRPIRNYIIQSTVARSEALSIGWCYNNTFLWMEERFWSLYGITLCCNHIVKRVRLQYNFYFSSTCTMNCRHISSSKKRAYFQPLCIILLVSLYSTLSLSLLIFLERAIKQKKIYTFNFNRLFFFYYPEWIFQGLLIL